MKRALALVAASVLAACTVAPSAPPAPPPRPAPPVAIPSTADRLLESLARLKAMDETALAAETARARQAAAGTPSDFSRLEAAMALSLAPASDEGEILALVGPVLRESPPAEAQLRAMAGFLQGMATERRKLRESLATASAKSRDDRREAQSQRQRADAQQERADRLQQKLEALTNLEKSLANRKHADDPNRRPR